MIDVAARFAVTGVGVVSAAGLGVDALRRSLATNRVHLTEFGCPGSDQRYRGALFASEFAAAHAPGDRAYEASQFALAEALDDAALPDDLLRRGIAFGSALGGICDADSAVFDAAGHAAFATVDRLAERLAVKHGLDPNGGVFSATCVSANYALEHAFADLVLDRCDAIAVGGVDTLSPVMRAGFSTLGALAGPVVPNMAFDAGATPGPDAALADGLVLGEAACFVVLERLSDAVRRGANIHAVVDGRGHCADAVHLTAPDEKGQGMTRAIHDCLAEARLEPGDIDRISVTAIDSARYAAMYDRVIRDVFGVGGVESANWEWSVGHVLAATGTFGIVYAALRFEHCPGRQLALAVGFGGQNGVLSLRSFDAAAGSAT